MTHIALKMKRIRSKIQLFILVYLISLSGGLSSQESAIALDSTRNEMESIELANISVRSGEVMINTQTILESIIGDDEITSMIHENDSLIQLTDSLLKLDATTNFIAKNLRFLDNKIAYWTDHANMMDNEKSNLASLVHDLDEQKYEMEHEILIWTNTRNIVEKQESALAVVKRIDQLVFRLDSIAGLFAQKTQRLLIQLDEATRTDLLLHEHTSEITQVLLEKEEAVFVRNQQPIWKLDLFSAKTWKLEKPLRQFYIMEVIGLQQYMARNIPNLIFQIILLIVLIIVFQRISKLLKQTETDPLSIYQRTLVRAMKHPISAALIIGLFASVLIFPNRPLFFKDISRILISIPLILVVSSLISKKYVKYLYLYGILVLIQTFYFVFPPGHGLYHISLLIISLIEIVALIQLYILLKKYRVGRKFLNRLIWLILYIQIGIAGAGLAGVLFGSTNLAEISVNVPIVSALAVILIVTSTNIINGLIEVGMNSKAAQKINVVQLHGASVTRKATELLNMAGAIFLLLTLMRIIKVDMFVIDFVTSIFTDQIHLGSVSFTLGGIAIFFLVIWLSIVISKMIRVILEKDILNKLNLSKGMPYTISLLVRYSLVTLGILLAVSAAGMPLNSLTILFGAFGVGIGFGLQNIFNNLVSGLILLFERPVQIGDTIEVGQLIGNVKSIGIRSSHVRTFDGAEVIVPNGQLISNEVVNWTLSDQRRRIEVLAGVAYGSDTQLVKSLFEKVLKAHPDVIDDPAPLILFNDLGESSLDFRLLFWTNSFDSWLRIKSEVIFQIHDILNQEGISIPFPQRDLHLRSVDEGIEIINKKNKKSSENEEKT